MSHTVLDTFLKNNKRGLDHEGIKLTKSEIRVEFYKTAQRLVSTQSIFNKSYRRAQGEWKFLLQIFSINFYR